MGFWRNFAMVPLVVALLSLGTEAASQRTSRVRPTPTPRPNQAKVQGLLDIRPTYEEKTQDFYLETVARLDVLLTPNLSLGYHQEIQNDFKTKSTSQGLDPITLLDGAFRLDARNIGASKDSTVIFSDEFRLYLPIDSEKRDAGMILTIRNYFRFRIKLTPGVSFDIAEVPIIHLYDRHGITIPAATRSEDPTVKANPVYENRIYAGPTFTFSGTSLWVPLILRSTKYADYDSRAEYNAQWRNTLYLYPELYFPVARGFQLGLAFETGNFLKPGGGFDFFEGLATGRAQFILALTFGAP